METKKSVEQYIGKDTNRYFKVPAYQRGYKWGVEKSDGTCDASILVDDILKAYANNKAEYFIQGVTVYENNHEVVLIDGQQRTTTIFLLLNLLLSEEEKRRLLWFNDSFKLKYEIRLETESFIEFLCNGENPEADKQDQYFIRQAISKMQEILPLPDKEKASFADYVLNKVKLFYIKIPSAQAPRIFSMLNGAKAFMTTDELVKSSFLSTATKIQTQKLSTQSLDETLENLKTQIGEEWQTTALRSRFARQWDRWLYWWNREDVKAFFFCGDNPMGHLLEYFYHQYESSEKNREAYSNEPEKVAQTFKQFSYLFIKNQEAANKNFEKLRKLQKKFEDIFDNVYTYNYMGLVLNTTSTKARLAEIHFFIENFKDFSVIKRHALVQLMGIKANKSDEKIRDFIEENVKRISQKNVYEDDVAKELAFKLLFMLNVRASSDKNVKFEFFYKDGPKLESYYSNRSLEHIWPKSKVYYESEDQKSAYFMNENDEKEFIKGAPDAGLLPAKDFDEEHSEHCLGNLLFLHKNDNSKFHAKLPEDKKLVYFNLDELIFSRNLLHSMSAFAGRRWEKDDAVENIKKTKAATLKAIKDEYGI
jgi:hypothetical protein